MQAHKEIDKHGVFFGLFLYRIPKAPVFYSSLKAGAKLLKHHGYNLDYGLVMFDPYIQKARNCLVDQFLKSDCEYFVFVADDLEYEPEGLLKLIETPGDLVVGTYRQKFNDVNYPVVTFEDIIDGRSRPRVREDGCIEAARVQTGFMRVRRNVFERFIEAYPRLSYYGMKDGEKIDVMHDFFPQGVYDHRWIGEDYAFCDLWRKIGGKIWLIPDLNLSHWSEEGVGYGGNYHEYLKRLPGGIDERKGKLERVSTTRKAPSQSLTPLIDALPIKDGVMAEIGVYTGEATELFYKSGKFKTIYSIDPWEDGYDETEIISKCNNMDVVEELFDKRVSGLDGIKKIKMKSVGASELFDSGSLDFVYIDGQHTYKAAKEDILAWMPKLKEGGVLAGHDYEFYPGVKQAVDEIFGTSVNHFPDTSWSKG